ncbi:hypothetical protein [Paraburkholderia sp. Cpub6]|uniref:hypothetical protein n=1 Tax=Paraburkholderia sp. Cpub6 TaxID=2723094 RepID=UPI00160AF927|nr:hypothetical protein [Paraburkholderia sp. Cpub6]MBB5459016.1 hypothetical protein [Paraburkholderia sp. Cpub6]
MIGKDTTDEDRPTPLDVSGPVLAVVGEQIAQFIRRRGRVPGNDEIAVFVELANNFAFACALFPDARAIDAEVVPDANDPTHSRIVVAFDNGRRVRCELPAAVAALYARTMH